MHAKFFLPLLLLAAFALSSCAKQDPHTGLWTYEVKNTPEGDFTGQMVLMKEKGQFSGSLISNGQSSDLKNLVIEDNQASFEATASGYYVKVEGAFESENSFEGTIAAEGYKFPFMATKISDKATP